MVLAVPAKWHLPLRRVKIRRNLLEKPVPNSQTKQRLGALIEALKELNPAQSLALKRLLVDGLTELQIVDELNAFPDHFWKEDRMPFTVRDVEDISMSAYKKLRDKGFPMHEVDSLSIYLG